MSAVVGFPECCLGTTMAVPAAEAARSRTTPLTSPTPASFATVSATPIAAQTNAATAAPP
jgi:hypothetical protein